MPALPVPRRIVLAAPRGWCAGVDRAVEAVRQALDIHGSPVYVRRQIVHNMHVVAELEQAGAVFVEDERQVPRGATLVLSAHGVAPEVRTRAAERDLHVIDATCPLVTKVHREVLRFAREGRSIVLVGHAGHDEVIGTLGEAPAAVTLVESVSDVDRLGFAPDAQLAYVTQTTLSVDETAAIIRRLRQRFPQIAGPARDDICYATSNRQRAIKQLAEATDAVLVIGSTNSSNAARLTEVALAAGAPAYLVEDHTQIDPLWLAGVDTLGVTSGASTPEHLVAALCSHFRSRGVTEIATLETVVERVRFAPPLDLRTTQPALV